MRWRPSRLHFGADYNPEQWPPEQWPEDARQMVDLGVSMVTVGVFSWAALEPREGVFQFEWLDDVLDILDTHGIRVDLATATASPPAWMTAQYPGVALVTQAGIALSHGGRQHQSPSSSVYRKKSVELASRISERYASHPALELWHVNNEIGCHNPYCFGEESERNFRSWLEDRYGSIEALNDAWATAFWAQRYDSFEQIAPPRQTAIGTAPNPGQLQDYRHFSSQQLLSQFVAERDAIRLHDTVHPITTNFMSMRHITALNYWEWAPEVDLISADHYANAAHPRPEVDLAFHADLTRGFSRGEPWLLMEHSPAAVNWQPRNIPKTSSELELHALSHIARGSQGAMFFQFRQSRGGSERFHSALVPHVGADSRVTRAIRSLSKKIAKMSSLASVHPPAARVAMVFDYPSQWALEQENLPSKDLDYLATIHDWYEALYDMVIRVDFIPKPSTQSELAGYEVVFAPLLHVLSDVGADALDDYVSGGGILVTSCFSGVVDDTLLVREGGYGGKLVRETCGVFVEEFVPLREGERCPLSSGGIAKFWTEIARPLDAEIYATYEGSQVPSGSLAVSKHQRGSGTAWYVGSFLERLALMELFSEVTAGLDLPESGGEGLELVRRGDHLFGLNHGHESRRFGGALIGPGASGCTVQGNDVESLP